MGFEKPNQSGGTKKANDKGDKGLQYFLVGRKPGQGTEEAVTADQGKVGAAPENIEINTVQAAHGNNSGKDGMDLQFGLQQPGYGSRGSPGGNSQQNTEKRVAGQGHDSGHRESESEAPIGGKIRNVEDAEGNIDAKSQHAVD
ncbi:hypothetical protein HMPREF0322_00648 [Desulfitobacterium hafniense DP7]|uniref:Uncharacterized protein n=1 Tax=Desulfitobacterium hafniense DP7 TaxID=537010 RepID=G9XI72_DESHA|nr:hypothetical protein HMPREF0322_00648 [Desulfitobacterium hafniense DP7]